MKNDYRRLVIALLCNGDNVAEENLGCRNKRCKYRDVDGACDIVGMCNDAAKAISDLLARAEKAESNLDAAHRLLAEKSVVNGTEKVETCFGYTLDKVRELVEANKAGRVKIIPEYVGKACGTCGHFHRVTGTRHGTCDVKPYAKSRMGLLIPVRLSLRNQKLHASSMKPPKPRLQRRPTMSERKLLTPEELREVPHGKIKDETLRHICDRANEIAVEPPRLDRSGWEPCEQCRNGNTIIDIPVCDEFRLAYKGKSNEQMHFLFRFPFCPHCGRPLTDAAWETLERRLAGREHQ